MSDSKRASANSSAKRTGASRRSSESGRKQCDTCGKKKRIAQFRRIDDYRKEFAPSCLMCESEQGEVQSPEELEKRRRPSEKDRIKARIQRELMRREMARRYFMPFIKRFEDGYKDGWVHHKIARELENFYDQIQRGEEPRLMIFLPPRTGKSLMVSDYFPSWILGKDPTMEIISASYSVGLPTKASRRIKDRIASESYQAVFPDAKLHKQAQNVEAWKTTQEGGFLAAGVGGGITGHGAHCLPLWAEVSTPNGPRSIEYLINACEEEQYVLSYDNGNVVSRGINGFITRQADHYYRVVTDTGTFTATGEHPVCVGTEGGQPVFRRVDDLRVGEGLFAFQREASVRNEGVRSMPGVQSGVHQTDSQVSCNSEGVSGAFAYVLSSVFGKAAVVSRYLRKDLRRVRSSILRYALENRPPNATWGPGRVLLQGLLRGVPFPRVCGGGAPSILPGDDEMLPVRGSVHEESIGGDAKTVSSSFLQPRMLRRITSWSAYKPGQQLPWAKILPRRVQKGAFENNGRESGVCSVWGTRHGCSPLRRGQGQQRGEQPGSGVQEMPCGASPSAEPSRVEFIERVDGPVTVGDLEVEGTHNFMVPSQHLLLNCFIIDDPVKDAEEADSETVRESVWDWWSAVASTRVAPGGGVLCLMTRWHDDDLAGRLLTQEKEAEEDEVAEEELEGWRVLSFPAIAEDDEWELPNGLIREGEPTEGEKYHGATLVRNKGEALHEERWPLRFLKKKRRSMLKRHWAALYQQNPVPDEGIHFTSDMFVPRPSSTRPLSGYKILAAFDLAISEKSTNDWTVGVVGGIDPRSRLHILDMIRGQWGTFDIVEAIMSIHKTYQPMAIGIEQGQIELAIDPVLKQRCQELGSYPVIDRTLKPIQDKQRRASPLQGMMQHHRVLFPKEEENPWVRRMREELLRFPAGRNDDIVDAMAWLARMALKTQPPNEGKKRQQPTSWKDKLRARANKKTPMSA